MDLSQFHAPMRPLFIKDTERSQYELSDAQIEFYHTNGYLAGIPVLDSEHINVLLNELNLLMDPHHPDHSLFYEFHLNESGDPQNVLFHALGAWRISAAFHDLLWHPAIVIPSAQLLQGAVRFWHDQLFCKPAHHGGVVAWHQDYSYWTRTVPMAHLSCWIGLDDATVENGCVQYIPGSHRWNLLPITGLARNMDSIQSVLTEEQKEQFKPVAIELKKGHASFHHPLMVHGSSRNQTNAARRATVINMFRDGVKSDSDQALLEGVPPVPKGKKMEGQFFPLLHDPGQ